MARPNDFICTAKTCFNSKVTHPSMGFYSFPSDPENCKIWLENCQRTDLSVDNVVKLNELYKLCSDHFERKYFSDSTKRTFLHKTTNLTPTPTIFSGQSLEYPYMDIFHHENTSLDIPDKLMNAELEEEDLVGDIGSEVVPMELSVKCDQTSVSFNEVQLSKSPDEERDTIAETLLCLEPTTELHQIETLCRLCMNIASGDFVEIFSNTAKAKEIKRMCQIVLPDRVQIGDGLPQRICHLCIPDLKTCATLVEKFKKADLYLRQIEKYSLFVEGGAANDIVDNGNTLSDKDFIQPVPKQGLVIPLHKFKSHNALVQKSLEILNGKNVNKSARISQKTPPIQENIKLVCVNIFKSKEGENSQKHTSKKLGNQTLIEDLTSANEKVNTALNNEEGIDRSIPDPSTRLSYKCLECREVLNTYPALVDHVETLHRQVRRVRQSGTQPQSAKKAQSGMGRQSRSGILLKVRCKQCDPTKPALFNSKAELVEHVAQKHVHQCSVCAQVFTSVVRLRNHETRHKDNKQCSKCGLVFKTGWKRRQHEASHSSEQSRICEICGDLLPTNQSFESHMKNHTVYSCDICGKPSKNYKSYLSHKQNHSKHHKCTLCFRRFATTLSYERHKILHATNVNLFQWPTESSVCEFCGARFQYKKRLKEHLMLRENNGFCPRSRRPKSMMVTQQDEETQHKCDICGKKYLLFKYLRKHRRLHFSKEDPANEIQDEETNHKCDVCGKKFVKIKNMQNHRRLHFCSGDPAAIQVLLEQPEIHTCEVCKKNIYGRLIFIKHSKRHTPLTNPYNCIICGEKFPTHTSYLIHERSEHTKDEPFKCSHCGKKFVMQHLMKNHIKILHPKRRLFSCVEGLFKCTTCNMKFESKFEVRRHAKVVHQGKTFPCKICNKEFKTKVNLEKHSLTHTGEKCACPICGNVLKHKAVLDHHMWRMHKNRARGKKVEKAKKEVVKKHLEYEVKTVYQDEYEVEKVVQDECEVAEIDQDKYEVKEVGQYEYEVKEVDQDEYEIEEVVQDEYEVADIDQDEYEVEEVVQDEYEVADIDQDEYEVEEVDQDECEVEEVVQDEYEVEEVYQDNEEYGTIEAVETIEQDFEEVEIIEQDFEEVETIEHDFEEVDQYLENIKLKM